jgi:hypothetical protein
MKTIRTVMFALSVAALFAPLTTALAKEIVSITISGPGLTGEVDVTDGAVFAAMQDIGAEWVPANAVPSVGKDFYIVRIGFGDETGEVFATNVYHYYTDPEGGRGYLEYFGMEGGSSSGIGDWFRAPGAWEDAFRGVLEANRVELAVAPLPAAQAEPAITETAAAPKPNMIDGIAVAGVVTALVAGVALRQARTPTLRRRQVVR